MQLDAKENIEIEYWKTSKQESPEKFTAGNFINKSQECLNLKYKIIKHHALIRGKKKVLEVGAGQGWASCFMKKFFLPDSEFTVTDISPHAVKGLKHWESVFDVKIEKAYASKSYDIKEDDASYDLIFCYAAAHHFVLYQETLQELKRLLTNDGHILFLYEPTCSKLLYPLHYYYVNHAPHVTPEDVLIPSKIVAICEEIGLDCKVNADAKQVIIRSIFLGIYFKILHALPFLQSILPGSSDFVMSKK